MGIEITSTVGQTDTAAGGAIRRAARRGELVRIHRGAYVDAAAWAGSATHERHLALVQASIGRGDHIVSHASAVALHRLPWIGGFGARVMLTDPGRDRGQVKSSLQRVGTDGRVPETVAIDGYVVTSLAVTGVDVALREHPWRAIVVLDAILRRGIDRDQLRRELSMRGAPRARRRARELIGMADASADSPGESITRWGAHVLGAPSPQPQREFPNEWGGADRVDFWFPGSGTIVEFDGAAKYRDPRYRNGRSAEEVVVQEKRREDRLRGHHEVHGFARVTWSDAMPAGQLPRRLLDAGVPLGPNWAAAWRAAANRAL
ncbi:MULTISPECIES: hypothetical protein [unclassified Curtobacterium]|uniref:hypothetical protein n=1 Tax=unclassified Curtobacterium TaxID=257496 RepID=UPI003801292C